MRAYRLILGAGLLLIPLVLSACQEQILYRPGVTAIFFQSPPTEVDILLVVDNSGSMQDEQEKLSVGFDNFVEFFDVADVDYHIGVTTTDMSDSGEQGELVSHAGTRVIHRGTDDPAEAFRQNVQVGIEGWGFEKGLAASAHALSDELADDENEGFLREDALLSVIFVSDEEDSSHHPVNDYINYYFQLKDTHERDVFNASALVGIDPDTLEPADCSSGWTGNAAAGHRYHDVAVQTGGVAASICESDFSDIVSEMGLASSRLLDRFTLDRRPRPDSIEMILFIPGGSDGEDGLTVPPEGTVDGDYPWEYTEDPDEQEYVIRYTDITSLPPIDTQIVLHYELF